MSGSSTPVQNAQLESIDQEIFAHESALRDLRSRRNLLIPISKLPVEVLCTIFMFCVRERAYRWHWLTITHICRLFRIAALNCPALWATPEFAKPNLASEMIERSKMSLLTVEADIATPHILDVVSAGLKEAARLKKIHISTSRLHYMDRIICELDRPAPFLDSLYLNNSFFEPYLLPSDFLADDAPRLSHIELYNCNLRWDSSLFRNLVHLKNHNPVPPAPTLDQFIDVLAGMPQLEVLDLDSENALPITKPIAKPHVNLPFLRKLCVAGALRGCLILLEHVLFPTSASVSIIAKCSQPPRKESMEVAEIKQLCRRLPIVRNQSQSRTGTEIQSLLVEFDETMVVEAWDSAPVDRETVMAATPPEPLRWIPISFASTGAPGWLKLEFSWPSSAMNELHDTMAMVIYSSLPLTSLRNLHIRSAEDLSIGLANTFGLLPNITTLTAEGGSMREIVNTLDPESTHASSTSSPKLTFPALRTFRILGADFDPNRTRSVLRAKGDPENVTWIAPLVDCLYRRQKLGSKLQILYLDDCDCLSYEDIMEFQSVIRNTQWDGTQRGYTSDENSLSEDSEEDMY